MSPEREHAIERKLIAKHDVMRLQARALYGDNPPTAEEWGVALKAVRDATFEAASAELHALMPPPVPVNAHQTTPGRVSWTIRGQA